MDPAEEEEGREKPPVIYTMENKPIVTCECRRRRRCCRGCGSGRCPLRARGEAGEGGWFWGAPAASGGDRAKGMCLQRGSDGWVCLFTASPPFLMSVGKLGVVSVVNNKPNVVLRGVQGKRVKYENKS